MGHEPGRLTRGARRGVLRLGPLQFRVEGKHRPYYDVNLELDTPCDCDDAKFHGRGCLHELAARLQNHDYPLMVALNEQLERAEQHLKEHGATTEE